MLQRRRWLPSPVPYACTPPKGRQNFLEVFSPYLSKFQTELRAPLAFSASRKNYLSQFSESPRGRRWVYADIYAQCIGQKHFSCPRPHIRTYGTRTALSSHQSCACYGLFRLSLNFFFEWSQKGSGGPQSSSLHFSLYRLEPLTTIKAMRT